MTASLVEEPFRLPGFSSCGTQAWVLHDVWGVLGLGVEPRFPAVAGRLLTTGPPGKSQVGSIY